MARDEDDEDAGRAGDSDDEDLDDEEDDGKPGRSRGYDDDDDDDDDDEEEEEETRRPKKRAKGGGMSMFDDEAEVDADEEEEDDNDEDVQDIIDEDEEVDFDKAREEANRRAANRDHLRLDGQEDVERILAERGWADNGEGGDSDEDDDDRAVGVNDLSEKSFLPTAKDPRLYMVMCKERHENKAVISLLQKYVDRERRGMPLAIKSAIAPDGLRGRIYIEAYSEDSVRTAISGLHLIQQYKVDLIPMNEMTQVLHVAPVKNYIRRGAWVRIKRGPYKGDSAQVVDEDDYETDTRVMIRLIPRIDLKSQQEEEDEEYDGKGRLISKKGPRSKARPPQKLFDKAETERFHNEEVSKRRREGKEFFVFQNDEYRYGLLYKEFAITALQGGDQIQPNADEFEMFRVSEQRRKSDLEAAREENEDDLIDDEEDLDLGSAIAQRRVNFYKGDEVEVISSDLKGLKGKVADVDGETVMVKCDENDEPFAVRRSDIIKSFTPGAHVRLAGGPNAGETGVVVEVKGDILTIVSDSTKEEVRALIMDVVDSSELSALPTNQAKSMYSLFDLVGVHSDPKARGIIVRVQRDSVAILDTTSRVIEIPVKEIRAKYNDRRVSAHDKDKSAILPGLTVRVTAGPNSQRQGVVKHIANDAIFFQAQDEIKNCGMLVVPAKNCVVYGQRKMTGNFAETNSRSGAMGRGNGGMGRGGQAVTGSGLGLAMQGGRGRAIRDELIGQTVTIRRGNHKGYKGRVLDTTDNLVRLELHGKMKIVSVRRELIAPKGGGLPPRPELPPKPTSRAGAYGGSGNGSYGQEGGRTPRFDGSRTPRQDAGSRTPGNWSDGAGSRTPVQVGSRTPRLGGGGATPRNDTRTPLHSYTPFSDPTRTPVHDSWRTTTPAHPGPNYDPYTKWEEGGGQGYSPYATANTPHTPALEPQTPAPGGVPSTPGPGEARTPGAPAEPRTPFTPAPGTPFEPGSDPRTPMTPGMDSGTADGAGDDESRALHMVDVEVIVKTQENTKGFVEGVAPDGSSFSVKLSDGRVVNVTETEITLVVPEQEDTVKFLEGENAGQTGSLLGVYAPENEGIVKIGSTGEIIIPALSSLGRLKT